MRFMTVRALPHPGLDSTDQWSRLRIFLWLVADWTESLVTGNVNSGPTHVVEHPVPLHRTSPVLPHYSSLVGLAFPPNSTLLLCQRAQSLTDCVLAFHLVVLLIPKEPQIPPLRSFVHLFLFSICMNSFRRIDSPPVFPRGTAPPAKGARPFEPQTQYLSPLLTWRLCLRTASHWTPSRPPCPGHHGRRVFFLAVAFLSETATDMYKGLSSLLDDPCLPASVPLPMTPNGSV